MNIQNRSMLALKYFAGHYRRYLSLVLAISFGFAIITVLTSLSEGMFANVYRAARQHYGGQLFVLGFHKEYGNLGLVKDDETIMESLKVLEKQPDRIVKRTLFFADGLLYFAGNSSRQKNVYGVDFDVEAEDFSKFHFVEGDAENLRDTNGIVISEPVANQLNARLGDDLTLKVRTKTGQHNTGTFIIRGIYRDESLFGYYKCFVDHRYLNDLIVIGEEEYSSVGFYFDDVKDAENQAAIFYDELKKYLPMSPFINNKEDYSNGLETHWEGVRYFVMTLELFVSQVSDLLTAMDLVSYFLYIMISLIVLVSISVTYKLIIHERTSEIGTMRAIGFQQSDIRGILITEAVLVFLISLISGALLSLMILRVISFFSFSSIPGFQMFMNKGRLLPQFSFKDISSNIILLALIIFPALWIPAFRASRLKLTIALSGNT